MRKGGNSFQPVNNYQIQNVISQQAFKLYKNFLQPSSMLDEIFLKRDKKVEDSKLENLIINDVINYDVTI